MIMVTATVNQEAHSLIIVCVFTKVSTTNEQLKVTRKVVSAVSLQ